MGDKSSFRLKGVILSYPVGQVHSWPTANLVKWQSASGQLNKKALILTLALSIARQHKNIYFDQMNHFVASRWLASWILFISVCLNMILMLIFASKAAFAQDYLHTLKAVVIIMENF